MANSEHVELLKCGAQAVKAWHDSHFQQRLDLAGADLSRRSFSETDLRRANLNGANLRETDLSYANLSNALLYGADLQYSNLTFANLFAAKLNRANLSKSLLHWTNFDKATFDEAVFAGASFVYANLIDVDLSKVIGLEKLSHRGPSSIGIDTLYKSRGRIPESFFRGCGVHESLIAMIPSLIGAIEPIQHYSCFISYCHSDEEFAKTLHGRLEQDKLRVWYAPEKMKGGRKLHDQIEEAIRLHDKLLLVLSHESMASEWVKTEMAHARQREVEETKQVLFPVSLVPFDDIKKWTAFDAGTGKDMAREIREYFIPDFSNWKDYDSFEASFKRLVSDLRLSAD